MTMGDTTRAAEQVWISAVRGVHPIERLRAALAFSESTRSLALSRLRASHPGRPDAELVEMLHVAAAAPPRRADDGS